MSIGTHLHLTEPRQRLVLELIRPQPGTPVTLKVSNITAVAVTDPTLPFIVLEELLGNEEHWYQVLCPTGQVGWTGHANFVEGPH